MSLLAVDGLQLMIPLVIKKAIDLLTMKSATSPLLFRYGLTILGLAFLMACFRYIWRYLIFGHSRIVERGLRNEMFSHLLTLSTSFYNRTKTGDLMARSINDINAVRMASGMALVALTDGLVLGLAAIGFMLSINVKLTVISLIPAPVIIILTRILTRRMSTGFESVQKTFSDLTERVREIFAGIRVVKAYTREQWAHQKVKEEGEEVISKNMDLAKTLAFFFPMMAIFTNTGLAIVIWLGGRLTILGDITTGDFVAFTSYLNLLTWPMMAMGWVTNLIQRGGASMRRINRVLAEVPEIKDTATSKHLEPVSGDVEIKGLSFRYPEQTQKALNDIHLKIGAGETVALVGRVGSGKSTLLHALPRLLDVPFETVFLGRMDIARVPIKTLRESIGFVTQDVFIFSDTIRNNVLFGLSGISDDRLEAVLQAADILEDVKDLDDGPETLLGERGITLSGGQRQRLTIARALVSDPPVLIMDDALSMVDTQTEERILNQVLNLRRYKTNLIVSHRISTIKRADRIAVLEEGRLVELGSHETLLELNGPYARLYEKQLLAQALEIGAE
jgi:ATP-binding cassette subfamily B protein